MYNISVPNQIWELCLLSLSLLKNIWVQSSCIQQSTVRETFSNWDKVSLQNSLEKNPSNSSYIFLLDVNFENPIVGLHVLYILNMHVKFCLNQMLFTIPLINLFFMHNFLSQKLKIQTCHWWHSYWS